MVKIYTCRFCLEESNDRDEMIVPCVCAGSQKYVHKTCLENWRASGHGNQSLTHCPTCGTAYRMVEEVTYSNHDEEKPLVCGCIPGEWFSSRSAIAILVTQDFLAIFVVSQAWLISLALVLRLCDSDGVLVDLWPGPDHKHEGFMYAIQHHKAPYYLCACFITFIVVGILYLWIEPNWISNCLRNCCIGCGDACNSCCAGIDCSGCADCGQCCGGSTVMAGSAAGGAGGGSGASAGGTAAAGTTSGSGA